MISAEQRARIRRLFFGEHWKVGTIATELGVHHDTVESAVETHRFDARSAKRPSMLDAYKPFIVETLEQHPRLRATRIFQMVRSRGYGGGVVVVRRYVREVRPAPRAEAYLRQYYTPTGRISVPVLTIHTTFDPLVPARDVNYYNVTTDIAGTQSLFVEKFVDARGHCAIDAAQTAAAFDALLSWVRDAKKPSAGEIK